MNASNSTTNTNNVAAKQEQIGFFSSIGLILKGAYTAPAVTASVVATAATKFMEHKQDFEEKTEQALDLMFNGVETTFDTLEAAQEIARETLYGVDNAQDLKNMNRQQRVLLLKNKFKSEE